MKLMFLKKNYNNLVSNIVGTKAKIPGASTFIHKSQCDSDKKISKKIDKKKVIY